MANLAGGRSPAITVAEQLALMQANQGAVPSPIAPGAFAALAQALTPQGAATGTGGQSGAAVPTSGGIDIPSIAAALGSSEGYQTRAQGRTAPPPEPTNPQLPGPYTLDNMPAVGQVTPEEGIADIYDYFTANIPAQEAAQPEMPEDIKANLQEIKAAPDILPVMQAATSPEDLSKKAQEIGFFDKPENLQLMLGLGIGLLQGKGLGDAVAMGVGMMQQAKAAQAGKPKAEADLALTKAKTEGELAKAALDKAQAAKTLKDAKKAGLGGKALTGYRSTVADTMEGLITQDIPAAFEGGELDLAKALAADTELAADPESEALQTLRTESIRRLFDKAWNMEDEGDRRIAVDYLGTQFPRVDFKQFLEK